MAIHNWPRTERPRERLIELGEGVLSDAELLALFLGSGPAGRSAVDLARHLLTEFGSLRAILNCDRRRLMQVAGVGPARYALLRAAVEMGRRYHLDAMRSSLNLISPKSTRDFLLAKLRDRPYEIFCCLYLDARYRLIAFEELFRGTVNSASVHPREVIRQVLTHNATAVILAHNHPSGSTEPSSEDEVITKQIKDALSLLGVTLVDHIIVGDGQCVSFLERGML
jgi:DNA repair protein RadC